MIGNKKGLKNRRYASIGVYLRFLLFFDIHILSAYIVSQNLFQKIEEYNDFRKYYDIKEWDQPHILCNAKYNVLQCTL